MTYLHLYSLFTMSPPAVFLDRETGQEASDDRGFYHDGNLLWWNHSVPHFTGTCLFTYKTQISALQCNLVFLPVRV